MRRKVVLSALAFVLVPLTALAVIIYKRRHEISSQTLPASSYAVGRDEERHGTMSSADYVHWEEVGNKVSAQRSVDDDDLDWAISMMQKPSTEPAEVHERMMAFFLTARTFGSGQQTKIRAAGTPLLASPNPTEVKYAKGVLKRLDRYAR